jgi:hypothetical protein
LFDGFNVERMFGHTESMMLPVLTVNDRKVMFMADLLPSPVHVPIAWVMAYDTRPLMTMQEKAEVLKRCVEEDRVLFFEHDYATECATLEQTEKGIRVKTVCSLKDIF